MDHFIKQANKLYSTIKFTAEISENEEGHEREGGGRLAIPSPNLDKFPVPVATFEVCLKSQSLLLKS